MFKCEHCGAELEAPGDLVDSMKIVRVKDSKVLDEDTDISADRTAKYTYARYVKCPACKKGTTVTMKVD